MTVQENRKVLYLGNLRCDLDSRKLRESLFILFSRHLGIQLSRSDIEIYNKGGYSCFSFVNTHHEHLAEFALDCLATWENRNRLGFNFKSICDASYPLKSNYKLRKKKKKKRKQRKRRDVFESDVSDDDNEKFIAPDSHNIRNARDRLKFEERNDEFGLENRKIIEFYTDGQCLGNETRQAEYKKGKGNYLKNKLRDHVCKYICAFLNSGEEGTLYIGVLDDGCVKGVECPYKTEDEARRTIDEAIKSFQPTVFPAEYTVKFTPVLSDNVSENMKVIEIHSEAKANSQRLYSSESGVFIRRDGSVQGPLTPAKIQEWVERRNEEEKIELREKLRVQQELLNKKVQREIKTSNKKSKRSKMCVVI